MTGGIGV